MKEMVDALTEYKLTAANKIADLERHCDLLKTKLHDFEQISIENEGMKRQIARLTDENDEQAMDLKHLDDRLEQVNQLSQKQNDELIILEQSVNRWKEMEVNYKRLQEEHSNLEEQCQNDRTAFAELEGLRSENKECKNAHNEMTLLHEKTMEDFERVSREMRELQQQLASVGDDGASVRLEQALAENAHMKEELGRQTGALGQLKCKLKRLAEQFNVLKKSRDLLVQSATEYNRSIDECKNNFKACSTQLLERIGHLESTNDKLAAQMQNTANAYEQEKGELENNYKEVESKYNQLLKMSDDERAACAAKEDKLQADASDRMQELQHENVTISESLKTLSRKEQELSTETVQLRTQLDAEIARTTELTTQLRDQETKMDQLHSELNAAKGTTTENAELVEKFQQIQTDLNQHKSEIKELATDLIIKQGKCDSLALQCTELTNKHQIELSEMREHSEALKNRNTSLSQELEILKKTEEELQDLQAELQNRSDEIAKAASKEQELIAQNQKLTEQFKTLETSECSSCTDLIANIAKKTQEIEKHQEELKRIHVNNENALKSCNGVINEMNDANEALKNQIMSLGQELEITKSNDHEEGTKTQKLIDQKQSEIDVISLQLNETKAEVKRVNEEKRSLKANFDEASMNLDKAVISCNDKDAQFELLEKQNTEIRSKYAELQKELDVLKNSKCQDCEILRQQMSHIQSDGDNTRQLLNDRQTEIETMKTKLVEIQNENGQQSVRIEALENEKKAIQIELNSLQNKPCNKCDELRANITETEVEIQSLKEHSVALETQLKEKRVKSKKAQQDQADKAATITKLQADDKQKQDDLLEELNQLRNAACDQCANLQQQIDAFKADNEKIETTLAEAERNLQIKIDRNQKLEETDQQMKQKNDELLIEMREINEALKNRGDVISKQNREISELHGSLEKSANRLGELEDEVKQKMATVEKLTSSVREYETRANDSFGKIFNN